MFSVFEHSSGLFSGYNFYVMFLVLKLKLKTFRKKNHF